MSIRSVAHLRFFEDRIAKMEMNYDEKVSFLFYPKFRFYVSFGAQHG